MTQLDRALAFRALHERGGAFVIPNPWDAGSARILDGLGFEALATTSSGFAQTLGRLDGEVSREEKLEHCRAISAVTDLPISADLENGFADDPEAAASVIPLAAEAGMVGASIEDYRGDESSPIYDFDLAVERVHAAAEQAQALSFPFMLTARAEGLLRGVYDIDEAIKRLQAFERAGADVLYAPALTTLEQVRTVVSAVTRPVNVLVTQIEGVTVAQLADAGATRLSIGGALARTMMREMERAGREMLQDGTFSWAAEMPSKTSIERYLG